MRTILVLALVLLAPASVGETGDARADTAGRPAAEESRADRASRAAEALARFAWREVGPPEHRWTGEPISLSLRDADLVEVLRSFAKMTDANLVLDPRVEGKVTVELRDVPWDQALYVILKTHGLGMEVSGRVWNLMPAENLLQDD